MKEANNMKIKNTKLPEMRMSESKCIELYRLAARDEKCEKNYTITEKKFLYTHLCMLFIKKNQPEYNNGSEKERRD
jgi:hypothetical protein